MVAKRNATTRSIKGRPPWWPAFLKGLATEGTVTHAAKAARIDRKAVYAVRNESEEAAAEWDAAFEEYYDDLERVAAKRGKRQSDTLLIFMLKGGRPEKYREHQRIELTGRGGHPLKVQEVVVRTRQEARELLASRNGHT